MTDGRIEHAIALAAGAGLAALGCGVWPGDQETADGPQAPPPVAGFVGSSFSPMVVAVAERCLRDIRAPQPVGGSAVLSAPPEGPRVAVVIVSASGDAAAAAEVARSVDGHERIGPLLFFASVPNAVAGFVAARWALTGPVVCLSPPENALAEGFAAARLLIRDGDADEALVVHVEQAVTANEHDNALAVLVRAIAPARTGARAGSIPMIDSGGTRP